MNRSKALPHSPPLSVLLLSLMAALCTPWATSNAATFSEWQFRQSFEISNTGLIKISLPLETLDAARPDLADLRFADSAENEMPYVIERPARPAPPIRSARSFQAQLLPDSTLITLETGTTQSVSGITLVTPATDFIKAVLVAGSTDGNAWQDLASGIPIFHQPNGASQLRVEFPRGVWPFLRLTIDDRGSRPVPFTGATLQTVFTEIIAPTESVPVQITARSENPGQTRLELNFGAAHLRLASLEFESPDPFFQRQITLAAREVADNSVIERPLATGTIYRLATAGQPASERLRLDLDAPTPSRELVLRIENGDSPPLRITNILAQRWPTYAVFYANKPGLGQLYSGNRLCPAPRYDLAGQGLVLKNLPLAPNIPGRLADNPAYRIPETLPQVSDTGTPIDISSWRFRKRLNIERPGVQQLDLDLEVLAHAQPAFADLRLVRNGRQLPFIIDRSATSRSLIPISAPANDPLKRAISRWSLKLPLPNLPLTRLTCTSPSPLFQRMATLYEETFDDRGGKYRRDLGSESWIQSPDRARKDFTLTLRAPPQTDTLFLEIQNEDNPPIELSGFEFAWPVTRVIFKTTETEGNFLYYGNLSAEAPHYDLSLVAGQLLRADKTTPTLGAEEPWKKASWAERQPPGNSSWLLWAVLGIVVIALLAVIARLMPKQTPPAS
jgi:hypothetical protein